MDLSLILLNIGFLLNFIALGFRKVLWIRILLTFGYFLRFITHYNIMGNLNSSIWMMIFVIINLSQIFIILNEKRERKINDDIIDLYENTFKNLSSYEFLNFWKLGQIRKFNKNDVIIKKHDNINSIFLILNGNVIIRDGDKQIILKRGSFIGEMSYLSHELTSAEVSSNDNLKVIEWNNETLNKIKERRKIFWIKLQNIFLIDLISKIKNS